MAEEKVDLLPIVTDQLPEFLSRDFDSAVEGLHVLERRTRIAKDDPANALVCTSIVNLCIEKLRWVDLQSNVSILAKRRGYSRRAVTEIVKLAMDALPTITDESTRIATIRCLLEVTEGKIFVEVERARLTSLLVEFLERNNELEEAMNLLQDLRLEILTTMDETERIGLMLHQFQLCLDTKDSLRASLCAEKIRDQKLPDDQLKLEFLKLLVRYHMEFTQDSIEIADSFFKIWKINNETDSLMNAIIYAILAPRSEKQLLFFNDVQQLRELTLMIEAKMLLNVILGRDLVPFSEFEERFGELIKDEEKKKIMRKRVIEHGLRTIAMYYTNIRLARLAELLQISVDELEEHIIDLVFTEEFYAKIDRPEGVVTFKKQKKVSELADEFANNISQVCKLVDKANSLIEKERQNIHRVKV